MDRRQYTDMFGPTKGDRIRLADSDILVEIEKDFTTYGDEVKFGGGKVIRDGMGQSATATREKGALDLLITNVVILDHWGVVKADIGVRDGRICGIGKAGNPDLMDGVQANLVIGASTEVIAGEGLDCHPRWGGYPYPFYLPTTDRGSYLLRNNNNDRRWNRPGHRNQRDHLHPRGVESPSDD